MMDRLTPTIALPAPRNEREQSDPDEVTHILIPIYTYGKFTQLNLRSTILISII